MPTLQEPAFAEQLLELPGESSYVELVDGQLEPMSPQGRTDGRIAVRALRFLLD